MSHLNKLSSIIKPSNFKSFLTNNINSGKLFAEIEIFLNENGTFENFITKGKVINLDSKLFSGFNLKSTRLDFFADKNDILVKNIFGDIEGAAISDGDVKLELNNGVKLNSNFNSKINLDNKFFEKNLKIAKKSNFLNRIENLQGVFSNSLKIEFDSTYKVVDYNFSLSGKIEKVKLNLLRYQKITLLIDKLNQIFLSDMQIKTVFAPKKV